MARKKVTLQWIANDSTRRSTFKKRRKGLMKKASELATLCDVEACVVVYGEGEAQPEVWPDVAQVAQVLARFKSMPELDQCKKMMDMEGFLRQRIDKLREQLHKARRENRDRETLLLLHDAIVGRRPGLVGISVEELASLGWMVENRLHGIKDTVERLQGKGLQVQGVVVPAATTLQLQLQLPQAANLLPPYGIAGIVGNGLIRDVQQAPHPQGSWTMEVARAAGGDLGALVYGGGFGGGRGSFGGAGTSAGMADMLPLPQFGNMGAGFAWTDPGLPFPFPPM